MLPHVIDGFGDHRSVGTGEYASFLIVFWRQYFVELFYMDSFFVFDFQCCFSYIGYI